MERYTRSFIGLMEHNNNGEWIKYKDSQSELIGMWDKKKRTIY